MTLDLFTTAIEVAEQIRDLLPDPRSDRIKQLPHATENTALYYRFLHELVRRTAPLRIVEVGTYVGTSAAHMAEPNVGGTVLTIDINPDAKRHADAIGMPNLTSVVADSMVQLRALKAEGASFDLCYIDGWHSFNQTYGEYLAYREIVREGGVLLFDDVALPMETNEMEKFWMCVREPKARVDHLHHTGFGIVQKRAAVEPEAFASAVKRRI